MGWRELSSIERQLLAKMLEQEFPGRSEIAKQIDGATVRPIDQEGSLEFNVGAGPRVETRRRIPVEAECRDEDGVKIHLLLHVMDGLLKELEIYKEDSSPVLRRPTPDRLEVVSLA